MNVIKNLSTAYSLMADNWQADHAHEARALVRKVIAELNTRAKEGKVECLRDLSYKICKFCKNEGKQKCEPVHVPICFEEKPAEGKGEDLQQLQADIDDRETRRILRRYFRNQYCLCDECKNQKACHELALAVKASHPAESGGKRDKVKERVPHRCDTCGKESVCIRENADCDVRGHFDWTPKTPAPLATKETEEGKAEGKGEDLQQLQADIKQFEERSKNPDPPIIVGKAEGEALRLLKEFKATYDCQRLDNRFDDVLIAFEQWLKSR